VEYKSKINEKKKNNQKCMHRYREQQVVARREENQEMSEINKGN